jgi:hypothetical protein
MSPHFSWYKYSFVCGELICATHKSTVETDGQTDPFIEASMGMYGNPLVPVSKLFFISAAVVSSFKFLKTKHCVHNYENSVHASLETYYDSVTKLNQLMVLREIIVVYH